MDTRWWAEMPYSFYFSLSPFSFYLSFHMSLAGRSMPLLSELKEQGGGASWDPLTMGTYLPFLWASCVHVCVCMSAMVRGLWWGLCVSGNHLSFSLMVTCLSCNIKQRCIHDRGKRHRHPKEIYHSCTVTLYGHEYAGDFKSHFLSGNHLELCILRASNAEDPTKYLIIAEHETLGCVRNVRRDLNSCPFRTSSRRCSECPAGYFGDERDVKSRTVVPQICWISSTAAEARVLILEALCAWYHSRGKDEALEQLLCQFWTNNRKTVSLTVMRGLLDSIKDVILQNVKTEGIHTDCLKGWHGACMMTSQHLLLILLF